MNRRPEGPLPLHRPHKTCAWASSSACGRWHSKYSRRCRACVLRARSVYHDIADQGSAAWRGRVDRRIRCQRRLAGAGKVKVDVAEKLSCGTLFVYADHGGMLNLAQRALQAARGVTPRCHQIDLNAKRFAFMSLHGGLTQHTDCKLGEEEWWHGVAVDANYDGVMPPRSATSGPSWSSPPVLGVNGNGRATWTCLPRCCEAFGCPVGRDCCLHAAAVALRARR